jgi:hypothetical protein
MICFTRLILDIIGIFRHSNIISIYTLEFITIFGLFVYFEFIE